MFKAELDAIAKYHGLTVSSYVHSALVQKLRQEREDRPEAFPPTLYHAIDTAIRKAIPAGEFDLEQAVETGNDPFRIMNDWFAADGRSLPRDYGVIFFAGWESYSPEEKIDALRDARKVLERTLKAAGPAEVKPFPLGDDMPSKQSIQRMIEEVELRTPRKRKAK